MSPGVMGLQEKEIVWGFLLEGRSYGKVKQLDDEYKACIRQRYSEGGELLTFPLVYLIKKSQHLVICLIEGW